MSETLSNSSEKSFSKQGGVHLKTLPFKLSLASFNVDILPICTYSLLKLLLFPESKDRFFSFARTAQEISLVLESKDIPLFPPNTLQHSEQIWRAIKVDEGDLGFSSSGVVSSIAYPLSQANIFIYYISTFETDYALIEDKNFGLAMKVLSNSGFIVDGVEPSKNEQIFEDSSKPTESTEKDLIMIEKLPYELYIARLSKDQVNIQASKIINTIFYRVDENRFFSFTETPSEVSLILDFKTLSSFESSSIENSGTKWSILQIYEGKNGFSESGTLAQFSKPLADAKISIFNFSTNYTDFTLLQEDTVEKSLHVLSETLDVKNVEQEK
eukprot:TRINITY_DN3399_c0_g1_i1.p1 TRINITY_DN3399_c0_g1~~TRINITY_DN3399_c0_g1_i1.p1  ORF type:complete len:327 (-),score=52.38 TRINITY_DN3399_c0_g1_i1:35-1015(-)